MFCSIEDAWGEKSFAEKPIFKQSDKPEHFANDSNENLYSKYIELKGIFESENQNKPTQLTKPEEIHEHFADESIPVCAALDAHMAKCARCRSKYMFKTRSVMKNYPNNPHFGFDLSNLVTGIYSNKDIITIFLFGLLVILLLQLFSK